MDLITQALVVRDWPLKQPGEELFFGYVVAIGVFPGRWSDEGVYAYADFAYNDRYTRYRLPNDEGLVKGLLMYLCADLDLVVSGHDNCGKVWVKLTEKGYQVDLP